VYATVIGNVTKGQRDGYPVREYAGFFGVWCGPTYGPRCDDWSGATTITLERLLAGLSVNAESTVVSPGSIPYFDYRASPETVDGNGMPLVPDSSHWIPDPDSAGGDPDEVAIHAAGSGVCQSQYLPACRRKIIGSGTFKLSAWVNGKWFEKFVHVSAADLNLSASPSKLVAAGDSITFTPTWSDGATLTPGSVTAWVWMPESSPGTTIACTGGVSPCKIAVNEPGTMTVRVTRNGVTRAAMAHISGKFTLTANPTEVGPGRIVSFTARSAGVPIPAMRWKWIPQAGGWDATAGCTAGQAKCHRVMIVSGTMWAWESATQGSGDSASVDITVSTGCDLSLRRSSPTRNASGSATFSMNGCDAGGGLGSDELDSLPVYNLDLELGSDVIANDSLREGPYPQNVVVPYRFAVAPGYSDSVFTYVDYELKSADSVVVMDKAHTLSAVRVGPYLGELVDDEDVDSPAPVDTSTPPASPCRMDVSKSQGLSILKTAIISNDSDWVYTQGGAKGGQEPSKTRDSIYVVPQRGDCTDFVWYAPYVTFLSAGSWPHPWGERPGTANYHPLDSANTDGWSETKLARHGLRRLSRDSARVGDVVVRGGHAGIFMGFDGPDSVVAGYANNGSPAKPFKANVNSTTGWYNFSTRSGKSPEFFRVIIDCPPQGGFAAWALGVDRRKR
jgi:hypothetical protein